MSGLEPYDDVNVRPVSSSSDPKDLSKPLLNANKFDASGSGKVKQSIISFPVQPAAAIQGSAKQELSNAYSPIQSKKPAEVEAQSVSPFMAGREQGAKAADMTCDETR